MRVPKLSSIRTRTTQIGLRGRVGPLDGRTLRGWALDGRDLGRRRTIDVEIDDSPVGSCVANILRCDLISSGVGDGRYGFSLELPAVVFDGGRHTIAARDRATGWRLPHPLANIDLPPSRGLIGSGVKVTVGAGDEALATVSLLGSHAEIAGSVLSLCVIFDAPRDLRLHQRAVEIAAGGLVLSRTRIGPAAPGGAYPVQFAAYCSAATVRRGLTLAIPSLGLTWPVRVESPEPRESPLSPAAIVAGGASVEGRLEALRISGAGMPVVIGWARDPSRPDEAVVVDLFANGAPIATGHARGRRQDVSRKLGGSAICGFSIELPPNFLPGRQIYFEARARGLGGALRPDAMRAQMPPVGRRVAERAVPPRAHLCSAAGDRADRTFTAIILTQDGAEVLAQLLESLQRFEAETFEQIVIVDHESVDDTAEVIERYRSALPIVTVPKPRHASFSRSNNDAARLARSDVLVFINNDVVLTGRVVKALGKHVDAKSGMVGLRLMDPAMAGSDGPEPPLQAPQHAGIHFSSSAPGGLSPFESRVLTDIDEAGDVAIEVPAVTAALMAVDRKLFVELGGFDEGYFYGWEDVDLCMRTLVSGRANVSINAISATHIRGYTRRTEDGRAQSRRGENRDLFLRRWGYSLRRAMRMDQIVDPGFWTGRSLNVGFVTTEIGDDAAAGDFMTALEFARAIAQTLPADVFFYNKREEVNAKEIDILVVMTDDFDVRKVKHLGSTAIVVAWARNWFNRWAVRPWRERFSIWLASSRVAADYLSAELGRTVELFPLATNAQQFNSGERRADFEADVVFTGNNWGPPRDVMELIDPQDYSFKVFGKGWENEARAAPYLAGAVPYERIRDVYKSARIVVDDSNFATATWGSLNSRVYDGLAAGTLVVTNNVVGAQEMFAGLLPTYTDAESLRRVIRENLDDPDVLHDRAAALQQEVFAQHTYDHRALEFLRMLSERASEGFQVAIKIAVPSIEAGEREKDWHAAQLLRRELEALGNMARIDCLDEWEGSHTIADDVNIVLRGPSPFRPTRQQINLMWLISHPADVAARDFDGFDRAFVASQPFVDDFRRIAGAPLEFLPPCTDPRTFCPPDGRSVRSGVAVIGDFEEALRQPVEAMLQGRAEMRFYGSGWERLVSDDMIGEVHAAPAAWADIYRTADLVVFARSGDLGRFGFVSSSLFGALACEAPVICPAAPGLAEIFGQAVRTYSTPDDLAGLVACKTAASAPGADERRLLAELVRQAHTFAQRARTIDAAIRTLDAQRPDLSGCRARRARA